MRRRSASAESTVAARRAPRAVAPPPRARPTRTVRATRCDRTVEHGDAVREPRREEHQADDAGDPRDERRCAGAHVEETELGTVAGERVDVERQRQQREGERPREHDAEVREHTDGQFREEICDLLPAAGRLRAGPQAAEPVRIRQWRVRVGEVQVEQRREPAALDVPESDGHDEQQPGDRDRQRERDQQADGGGEEGDDERERDRAEQHVERDVARGSESARGAPRSEEVGDHVDHGKEGGGGPPSGTPLSCR